MNRDGSPIDYLYDSNDRLLAAGPVTFTSDANGNMTSTIRGLSQSTYSWDFDHRLQAIHQGSSSTQFAYDADGNRVARQSNGLVTRFTVDSNNASGLSQVLEERDQSGALTSQYAYGLNRYAMSRNGAPSFYLPDALGEYRDLADSDGDLTDSYNYDAFGELTEHNGSTQNPYQFAGEEFDASAGLYNLRARWMSPETGRFVSADPFQGLAENPATHHPYVYAEDDPVDRRDPSGYFSLIEENEVVTMIGELVRLAQPVLKAVNTVQTGYDILTTVYTIFNLFAGQGGLPRNYVDQLEADMRRMGLPNGEEAADAFLANTPQIISRVASMWRTYLLTTMPARGQDIKRILAYMPSPILLPEVTIDVRRILTVRGKHLPMAIVLGGPGTLRLYGGGLKIGPFRGDRGTNRMMFRGEFHPAGPRISTPNEWSDTANPQFRFVVVRPPSVQ